MFIAAYFVARFLWVPLLACWAAARGASGRGAMWLPIIVGLLATIWELAIPASMNIRIDIMLVGPVLMFADGLAGILLAAAARRRVDPPRQRAALVVASALCIAACGFFIFAWAYSGRKADDQYQEHVEGSRNYFEVAFRDDETQRAIYGNLDGTRWAGYYVSDPPQPSFAHLVVNAAGDYFVYTRDFYERHGRTKPDPADPALLKGVQVYLAIPTRGSVELRDLGGGRLQLRQVEGSTSDVAFVKRPPPRFPRAASPADKVRFKGVFSGVYDDTSAKWIGLAQVWLWEGEGRMWAVWLRATHSREHEQPVFANAKADVSCADKECTTLEVRTEGANRETIKWESPDALAWNEGGRAVTLKRGEIVTGLPFSWAPLTTPEENRKWLRSLHPDIAWKAPSK